MGSVVGSSRREDESSSRLSGGRDNATIHTSDLVDAAGHEDAPVVVTTGFDVLFNHWVNVVFVGQYFEIVHYNNGVLWLILQHD